MKEIRLPELGERIEKATVAHWYVKPGDAIRPDDDVVEVVTDKASFHIPAGAEGLLSEICVEVGQDASVGSTLALLQ